MSGTKQFTIFFLLVVVFLVAIMIVTALATRESTTTYDVSGINASLHSIVDFAGIKIAQQETAMNNWVTEVQGELDAVQTQLNNFDTYVHTVIQ